ncbi:MULTISPECIES: PadR family transcriptional regulator [unclassified Exiguobacterium]|uniref:PadR family transcriptional regulator n=1 Tax=unclassified Exiguobacterium TaxID=2644629 RepID=UPI0008B074C6|nr:MULTISPECIES: helix-turn-helix transcriptional regulator [unclassified Exiguobacterium]OGX79889.1 PadR family transcriptional regulator [Exiguobacterium sp. SH31]TCI39224.1 PadR family transcriptional regulator [Exiguobacterium sp. SH4S7]TCI48092.1 PadR family transcriptional regulator [Exiguobacterium sp. SH5S32]TCI54976.1 PadR family transcriptional regulator [Exiguobacterium sp. SH1S4]TCI57262.1 PadR family transcriptional regulator [Exiguobacterium sp. SH1S21]
MTQSAGTVALTEAVYYILLSLQVPRHGYGIMQFVQELSDDRVQLAAGTLYGALSNLVEKGWIEAVEKASGRKKEYVVTPLGQAVLEAELVRLEELVTNGKQWIGGNKS